MVVRNINKYIDRQEFLLEYLRYDAQSGKFFWMKRPVYSTICPGDEAGATMNTKHGRRLIKVKGKVLYAHHVAWFMHYGYWPKNEIDHINGNGLDNRIINLREATREQNSRNRKPHSKTGNGLKGAFQIRGETRWFAQIRFNGKQVCLGRFATENEAHQAYCAAALKYHGEFARIA